jgi:gamma-glutamyl hercynylcysteine S-oxide synthase
VRATGFPASPDVQDSRSMPSQTAAPVLAADEALGALAGTRMRTLALVAHLDDAALERVHSPLMSPLVWDLGHIAAFEDLWLVHRFAGEPLLRPDLAAVYDAFETPRAQRGELPYLGRAEALDYLAAVRERALAAIEREGGIGDGVLHELVIRHEQQHTETMLQTMELARLPAPDDRIRPPALGIAGATGLDLIEVPAGPCTIGAGPDGFAYDNERPRHTVELPAFKIGRTPVTNASWLTFTEGGGYERREWWSAEGWAWKEEFDIERPAGWTADGREWRMERCEPLHPDRPVVHVSWFEADAFARAHGARLPSEAEWEKAATWDQQAGRARSRPDGLDGVGAVWEWTSSRFDGYPGFVAFPYREYSEVFFGGDYRVLRGGSWATHPRVATPTFRNWDHPQRRQIFSGLRIAKDT